MKGLAAATELFGRAGNAGCFVESVCLCASIIDGALRIGLILRHQLDNRTSELLPHLLYQGSEDPAVLERSVYRQALAKGVIDQDMFDELAALYDDRNHVVHRYIISDITTESVRDIALRYHKAMLRVSEHIGELENAQIREQVGMVVRDDTTFALHELLEFSQTKHGSKALAERLRNRPLTPRSSGQ